MKNFCLLISILFFSQILFGQEIVDKLSDFEKRNYSKGIQKKIDSLTYFANKMQASTDPCTKIYGKFIEANNFYKLGNYNKSEAICLKILKEIKDKKSYCYTQNKYRIYERLFWILKNTNRYKDAFNYLVLKDSISNTFVKDTRYHLKKLANESSKALIKSTLCFYDEAIDILKKAISKVDQITISTDKETYYLITHKSSALNILGDVYYKKSINKVDSNLDSANVYYTKAYETALSFSPPHKDTYQLYTLRRIKVLLKKGDNNTALSLLKTIDKDNEKNSIEQDLNFYKATIYYNVKNSDSTLLYAHHFLNFHKNTPNTKKNLIQIYDILSNQYNLLKKKDSAYKYSKLGLAELSELNENKTEINKSHYEHNFKQVKKDNEVNVKTEHKTHITQIVIISLFSFGLLLFIVYRFRKIRDQNKENFESIISEIKTTKPLTKKDYNIEKELEKTILKELQELEKSTDFLSSNYTLKVLANKLNTNTTYVSYIINNSKKKRFKQYITELRINYLIEKLNNDVKYRTYTIQYLAEEIGYTNASAFTRAFKKQTGITPSEYIKSLKE